MPDMWVDVDTAVVVPVNILALLDDTDFKTRETGIAYNASGMALTWNFVTTAGATTQTAVTPTTGGVYDWAHLGGGLYSIEIPASGGASINNDTEGVGWFTGFVTGVLPWRGPTIGFRRKALNDLLIAGSTASTNLEDFFDGTGYAGGTAKLTVDLTKIGGAAVSTSTAQLGVNAVQAGGQSVTATKAVTTDVLTDGIKVSVGTGAGQINASSGAVPVTGDLTTTMKNSVGTAVMTYVVEGSLTFLNLVRLLGTLVWSKSTGGGTTTLNRRDYADTKNRITKVVDSNGNTTSISVDGT